MRTLQRLRYVQPPSEESSHKIRSAERRKVGRKERNIWLRRARGLLLWFLLPALLVGAGFRMWGSRFVADGLVSTNLVVLRAPAAVRVAEVFCAPGQRFQRGQALMRLESRDGSAQRRSMELAVEEKRLRLELVQAGANLGNADLAGRGDRALAAQREVQLAQSEQEVADSTLQALRWQRSSVAIDLRQQQALRAGSIASLEQNLAAARALVESAKVERELADFVADYEEKLAGEGVRANRDLIQASAERNSARHAQTNQSKSAAALERQLEGQREALALEPDRQVASLAHLDARIEEVRRRRRAARVRRELWEQASERYSAMGAPTGSEEARSLRELELALARTELAESQAKLAELDRLIGNQVLRAEVDGLVERVFARPGESVDADEALVRMYDPAAVRVIAYVRAGRQQQVRPGQACRIVPAGTRDSLEGRVEALDSVWLRCPEPLLGKRQTRADLRLPVHIEITEATGLLRPNMRVRVIFTPLDSDGA